MKKALEFLANFLVILMFSAGLMMIGFYLGHGKGYRDKEKENQYKYCAMDIIVDYDRYGDIIHYDVKRIRRNQDSSHEQITLEPSNKKILYIPNPKGTIQIIK